MIRFMDIDSITPTEEPVIEAETVSDTNESHFGDEDKSTVIEGSTSQEVVIVVPNTPVSEDTNKGYELTETDIEKIVTRVLEKMPTNNESIASELGEDLDNTTPAAPVSGDDNLLDMEEIEDKPPTRRRFLYR